MFARFLTLGAAHALSLPASAADEPGPADLVLRPSSNWIMNYKDNSCGLQRVFGAEGQTVMLDLDRLAPGDSLQVSVQSGDFALADRSPRIVYLPRGEFARTNLFYRADFPEGRKGEVIVTNPYRLAGDPALRRNEVPPERQREAIDNRNAEITTLRLENVFKRDIDLQLGSMRAPMKALDDCVDDLVRDLGVETLPRDLSVKVTPKDEKSWAEKIIEQYSLPMGQDFDVSVLQARLIVDDRGNVVNCHARTQDAATSHTACARFFKHGQFNPAVDKQGVPVKSIWATDISYRPGLIP